MNLILFEEKELETLLPYNDPRAVHIRDILHLGEGDSFSAGIIGGQIGKGKLIRQDGEGWRWTFSPTGPPPPLHPITLILGCPRPPVARRLLKDMSTLGIREFRVCTTDLNEKSYLGSKLWREGLWKNALIAGAVQGGSTLIPAMKTGSGLDESLDGLPPGAWKIAFDNEVGLQAFGSWKNNNIFGRNPDNTAVLAVGPERGWSDRERDVLDNSGFIRLHLGERILRTETACSIGVGLMLSKMGFF